MKQLIVQVVLHVQVLRSQPGPSGKPPPLFETRFSIHYPVFEEFGGGKLRDSVAVLCEGEGAGQVVQPADELGHLGDEVPRVRPLPSQKFSE